MSGIDELYRSIIDMLNRLRSSNIINELTYSMYLNSANQLYARKDVNGLRQLYETISNLARSDPPASQQKPKVPKMSYDEVYNLARELRRKVLGIDFVLLKKLLDKIPQVFTAFIIEAPHGIQLWSGDGNVEAPLPIFAITNPSGEPYADIGVYSPKKYTVTIDAESIFDELAKKHSELIGKYSIPYAIFHFKNTTVVARPTPPMRSVYDIGICEDEIQAFVYDHEHPPALLDLEGGCKGYKFHVVATLYAFEVLEIKMTGSIIPLPQPIVLIVGVCDFVGYVTKEGTLYGGSGFIGHLMFTTKDLEYVEVPHIMTIDVGDAYVEIIRIVANNFSLVSKVK